MKEFMMIFRMAQSPDFQPTAEQLQESIKHWQDWIGGIAAQGKIVNTNQLGFTGKTLKADGVITDGPYAEVKEIVGGYLIVRAENIDEAMTLAEGCPILFVGGHVEVREIMRLNP
jgi:prepilin-type processing-associated H-X9-DG protein